MQKQHLLKEQNGASLKPETHTPSFALDFPVVVIDEMTAGTNVFYVVIEDSASLPQWLKPTPRYLYRRHECLLHPVVSSSIHWSAGHNQAHALLFGENS